MRRHEIDLELNIPSNSSLIFQSLECGERLLGDISIEQVFECHVLRFVARPERVSLELGGLRMQLKKIAGLLQRRAIGEDRLEPEDPVKPGPGLAVRNALDAGSKNGADGFEHL